MRVVIQRVTKAMLFINNELVNKIDKGILVLLGIEDSDKIEDILWLTKKIVMLRIFNDSNSVMNKNVLDVEGEIMVISQFTLFASTKKGSRPSYSRACNYEIASKIYDNFIELLEKNLGKTVKAGKFGADMQINLINDGPVTIIVDTKNKE
jgi:D-aminoacyl-tRNA deacylase